MAERDVRFSHDWYHEKLAETVKRLRDMADEIERDGHVKEARHFRYSETAADVVFRASNLTSLRFDALTRAAAKADLDYAEANPLLPRR